MSGMVRWPFWVALAAVLAAAPFAHRLRARFIVSPQAIAAPPENADYILRTAMVPMRDGVRLRTLLVIPKGAQRAPILLTRTPYDAARHLRGPRPHLVDVLPPNDAEFARSGYIRVYQDVRGRYGSEGDYVLTRPLRGPLNDSTTDHATDAWDSIEWL